MIEEVVDEECLQLANMRHCMVKPVHFDVTAFRRLDLNHTHSPPTS